MNYPDWLIQDIRVLKGLSDIENLTYEHKSGVVKVRFDLHYAKYAQIEDERLNNPEPIILNYNIESESESPSFLSGRDDFPRDLPHLNPVAEGRTASICLWRKGNNSAVYMQ